MTFIRPLRFPAITATLAIVAPLLWTAVLAQAPSFEGTWYGTINPPGATFEIALTLQNRAVGWGGTLLLENGTSVAVKDVVLQGSTITFALQGGKEVITFKGALTNNGATFAGDFTQSGMTFPFRLTRTPSPSLQGASLGIDPSELLGMMTSFSGPPSNRPFVPPVTFPAIGYGVQPSHDPVANLIRDIQEGKVELKFEGEDGYLNSLLEILHIPVESQLAVFSKNSLQSAIISPQNPRRLYFNDSVSVGWVRGGFIEIASQDPELGVNFYQLIQQPAGKPPFLQPNGCLGCHISRNSMDVPGMLMRSVYPEASGKPVNPLGSFLSDHRSKFEERWGGWYVTGRSGSMPHMGNAVVSDPEKTESMTPLEQKYPSDIVALMVFQHQMHMMNLLTRVGWEFRVAASLDSGTGKRNDAIDRQLRDAANELVDYMLFVDEPALPGKVEGTSGFTEKFSAAGPNDTRGRSLRQLDLERRLMKYPCSYMIYSPAFDALPAEAKKSIYERMWQVMSSKLSSTDRQAVVEILRDTKKDLPDNFKTN